MYFLTVCFKRWLRLTMCPWVFWPISPPNVTIGEMHAKNRKMAEARHCMLMPSFIMLAYILGL